MLIQEPVQAAIWHCLNHYAYDDAIFLAELLHSEVQNEDTIWLLATCYYRKGRLGEAYSLLKHGTTPQCKYLLAKCCVDMKKITEIDAVLNLSSDIASVETVLQDYGDISCFIFILISNVCFATKNTEKGLDACKKALKLNPMLWSMFEQCCQKSYDYPDPKKIFSVGSVDNNLTNITGNNPIINYINSYQAPLFNNGYVSEKSPAGCIPIESNSGSSCLSGIKPFTPDNPLVIEPQTLIAAPKLTKNPKRYIRYFGNESVSTTSPVSPSFGIIPLSREDSVKTEQDLIEQNSKDLENSITDRRTKSVLGNRKNALKLNAKLENCTSSVENTNMILPRRSTRLFKDHNSKDKNTNNKMMSTPKSPMRRMKNRSTSNKSVSINSYHSTKSNKIPHYEENSETKLMESSLSPFVVELENNENLQINSCPATKPSNLSTYQAMQRNSIGGLLELLIDLGSVFIHLTKFECTQLHEKIQKLPQKQQKTSWIISLQARAYFEQNNYESACTLFEKIREIEPYRLQCMEIYSTALWYLSRMAELSKLTQDMLVIDRNRPETWCAAGNCLSLANEHDRAIESFRRAVQVDPNFAYAYTLLGHEYYHTEELDKALNCYRAAAKIDCKHYNAWYGIGTIYSKKEQHAKAEAHYRQALKINPTSSILMCHVGMVQMARREVDRALETLTQAIKLEPKNPLCKFHRASILQACGKYAEALVELKELENLVPKESVVFYLIGKVHKKLGNTHSALRYFSWATELDPRGGSSQLKEAIIEPKNHDEFQGDLENTDVATPSTSNDNRRLLQQHTQGNQLTPALTSGNGTGIEEDEENTDEEFLANEDASTEPIVEDNEMIDDILLMDVTTNTSRLSNTAAINEITSQTPQIPAIVSPLRATTMDNSDSSESF